MEKRLTLNNFISPDSEISALKGVPNTEYWHNAVKRALVSFMSEYALHIQDFNVRKRYRGRRVPGVRDVSSADGYCFSLYIDDPKRPVKPFDNAVLILANEIENAGVIPLETGSITFSEWLKETDFSNPYNSVFVSHEWYGLYRDELERYYTSMSHKNEGSYRDMFVTFIREKQWAGPLVMSQLDK
jgi:hypothetical protein